MIKKRFVNIIVSVGLCSLLTLSSAFPIAYAESNSDDFDSDLNRIALEYSQYFPQHKERIELKVEAYRSQDSYREYYEENPNSAIENVCDSLDYYIEYYEGKQDGNAGLVLEGVSPLYVDSNPSRSIFCVNTPLVKQENGYYCGPACVYMTIEGIKNHMSSNVKLSITNTQKANAAAMGTNSSTGTSEGAMRNRLSDMLTGKRYLMDYSNVFTEDEFITYIKNSLASNGPVVLLIEPTKLSYYPSKKDYGYDSGHYVVVSQYIEYIGQKEEDKLIKIQDPNNLDNGKYYGTHDVTLSELYDSFVAMLWIK